MHAARLLLVGPDAPGRPTPAAVPGPASRQAPAPVPRRAPAPAPVRLDPPPRRERPTLLVALDADPSTSAALVWALREAARREATVLAVSVCADRDADDHLAADRPAADHGARLTELDTRVRAATAEAGVRPRVRTAVLDPHVFEALAGAARGADLVVVGRHGKTLLRPAVPRTQVRRPARPA